jgi:hypothetical protein
MVLLATAAMISTAAEKRILARGAYFSSFWPDCGATPNLRIFIALDIAEILSEVFRSPVRTISYFRVHAVARLVQGSSNKAGGMSKETRTTIETSSLVVLKGRSLPRGWCPACGVNVEMIEITNAAVVSNLDSASIETWLNSERVHRLQAGDGSTLICLNSLLGENTKRET